MEQLLELLQDRQFHSGEELGSLLGVSRAAVWKQLQRLEPMGIEVEKVRGKGYRLSSHIELLNSGAIEAALDPAALAATELLVSSVTTSTNDDAFLAIEAHPEKTSVCLADYQTKGRGRRGKHWYSPYGSNVYISFGYQFLSGIAALEGLSLAAGVALVKSLENCGYQGIQLKWPNDLLFNDRKLAGVLTEVRGDYTGVCQVVIGVGLNLSLSDSQRSSCIDQPVATLEEVAGQQPNKSQIIAALINSMHNHIGSLLQHGFESMVNVWQSYDAFYNRNVKALAGSNQVDGVGLGVDSTGGYLIQQQNGDRFTCRGGEISLRCHADS